METLNITTEPAIAYKHLLSAGAYELINKMILDFKSKLPPEERVYQKKDNASLIYNLFRGDYKFSYKQYKEVYDALCDCTDKPPVNGSASDFERELYKLINAYISAGLNKPDLLHKMEYVTQSCRVS